MRSLAIVVVALALAACDKTVAPERAASIRSIGVISAIGDEFYHRKIGFTVFGNDVSKSPIGVWMLDDHVLRTVGNALRHRYDVRAVSFTPGAFAADKIYFQSGGGMFGGDRRPVWEVVRTEVQPQGLDAYVVITKGETGFSTTNQGVAGIGVVQANATLRAGTYLHALYWVTVVDGRDFKVIGDTRAPMIGERSTFDYLVSGSPPAIRGPFQSTMHSYVVNSLDALAPDLQARLQSDVKSLLDQSLPAALREVKLLDAAPAR